MKKKIFTHIFNHINLINNNLDYLSGGIQIISNEIKKTIKKNGTIFLAGNGDYAAGTKDKIDAVSFIDLEANYRVSDNLSVVLGANNITNAYPTEIATRASQGMPYPRRSPLGYHGGFTYMRLMYSF